MAKRRGAGEGSVTRISRTHNGKTTYYWQASISNGIDPATGRRVRLSKTFHTQREAVEWLKNIGSEISKGEYVEPAKMSTADWLDVWLTTYLTGLKPSTVTQYDSYARRHINPYFGKTPLAKITVHAVQQFVNNLLAQGLSAKTARNIHGVLHAALEQAVDNGLLKANPAARTKLPRAEKFEVRPLDLNEIAAFRKAAAGTAYELPLVTTLELGLRAAETLGLTWDEIDFTSGTVTIKHQLQRFRDGSGYHLIPPKGNRPRTIYPAESTMKLLKVAKARQAEQQLAAGPLWHNDLGLVFTQADGSHLTDNVLYRSCKQCAAQIGLPSTRLHDLRHTFAVCSLAAGVDLKTVQENLGHATAAFTLEVYGHSTTAMKKRAATRLETLFEETKTG